MGEIRQLLFQRDARLLAGIDFLRVFETKNRIGHPLLSLHWAQRNSPNQTVADAAAQARLGLAVSRKVDKRAVVRNRIKRYLREDFRHLRDALGAVDIVVVARPAAAAASHHALSEAFLNVLRRAGALP